MQFIPIEYGDRYHAKTPPKNSAEKMLMRCIWTSYDYVTSSESAKKSDNIVVGGVCFNRMYQYPKPHVELSKWNMRQVYSTEDTLKLRPYPPQTGG